MKTESIFAIDDDISVISSSIKKKKSTSHLFDCIQLLIDQNFVFPVSRPRSTVNHFKTKSFTPLLVFNSVR